MKLLLVTSSYPSDEEDPRGIFVHRLAVQLRRRGLDILVLAPGAPNVPRRQELDGVRIVRVTYWVPRWQRLAVGLAGIMPNLKKRPWLVLQACTLTLALIWASCRVARSRDLINAHWLYPSGIAGAIAARVWRIPLVVTSQGGDLNLTAGSRVLALIARRVARAARACVGVSQALCDRFVDLGVPPEKVSLISSIGAGQMDSPRGGAAISPLFARFSEESCFKVLYLGSLIPRKSVHTLLEAHGILWQHGLRVATAIVGEGPERARLSRLCSERSMDQVYLIGQQGPRVVADWFSQADVLVLPSLSEGRPNVVLEAMAHGLPVAASDIPGTREIVQPGVTGWLFRPGDPQALADCLEKMLASPGLALEMGRKALEYITEEGLTADQVTECYLKLFEGVLSAGERRGARAEDRRR